MEVEDANARVDQADPYVEFLDDVPSFSDPPEDRPPPGTGLVWHVKTFFVPITEIHGCRMIIAHTNVQREFLHIVVRSSNDNLFTQTKQKRPMLTCDTVDGPYMTKWSLHFYPDGHPSNYILPDMDWFPQNPPEEKYASLYVRLKEGYEMVEARMMTTVLGGDADIQAAMATNMERFMLCPRMKVTLDTTKHLIHIPHDNLQVDEFHKDAAGHGWPKLCQTENLKKFQGSFICVVSLQVLKPTSDTHTACDVPKHTPIVIQRYKRSSRESKPFIMAILRRNNAYSDAVLQARDWQFVKAHRFVLAKSPIFRGLLTEDQGLPFVHKTDFTIQELNYLLDMLYTGKLPCRTEALSKVLLNVATKYEVPVLLQALRDDEQRFVVFSGGGESDSSSDSADEGIVDCTDLESDETTV